MQNFKKRIPVEGAYYAEFFFNRIYTANGVRYHVSVIDRSKHSYAFNMELKSERWKIIDAPKLPEWIMQLEKELEDAILNSMTGLV